MYIKLHLNVCRQYLNKINAENPNITSVPIKSLSTITYWMPVQHETLLGQVTYLDMGEEVAYIAVNKEVDLSIPYAAIQSVMQNDKLRTIQVCSDLYMQQNLSNNV